MKDKPFSVLIIDDNTDRNSNLMLLLRPLGFSVHQAYNGLEGIRISETLRPDLVLLDVLLPDIHGFNVLASLRENTNTQHSFVVMISSNLITSEDLSGGLERGADGYLIFPMTNREFVARIQAFVKHKQTMDQLRESEARLQTLLNSAPYGIIMQDVDGTILYCNDTACNLFNKSQQELVHSDLGTLASLENESILEIPSKEGVSTIEIRQVVSASEQSDLSVMYLHDITGNRLTEQKLNTVIETLLTREEHQDKLFSLIAHDLKGPFGTLLNFSQIVSNELDSLKRHEIKRHLGTIISSSRKIFTLLINLLDWTRIRTGSWTYVPKPVVITEVVEDVCSLYKDMADQKNIRLKSTLQGNANIIADAIILQTIIRNLVGNAIRYTDKGGLIEISVTEENGSFDIVIADTGVGMSEEKLKKLFQKNLLGEKEHPESGTGLGLIICKELIEICGGTITVDSELNRGTKIQCFFPATALETCKGHVTANV